MNNLEDYIKSLLIEDDCNVAMNNILNKYFEDNEAPQTASEIVENGTYYIMDPFPFLLFDRNGNLSQKMVTYCKAVLADYDAHKNEYRHYASYLLTLKMYLNLLFSLLLLETTF